MRSTFSRNPGWKGPVPSSRRGVPPAQQRRVQDDLDAQRMLDAGAHPKAVREKIAERGSW